MIFRILMLLTVLLIPAVMIFIGHRLRTDPPVEINRVSGYRSAMSMKNSDTWKFANEYCGGLWVKLGFVLLIPALAAVSFLGRDIVTAGTAAWVVTLIQIMGMTGSTVPVEMALRRRFHPDGTRKEQ